MFVFLIGDISHFMYTLLNPNRNNFLTENSIGAFISTLLLIVSVVFCYLFEKGIIKSKQFVYQFFMVLTIFSLIMVVFFIILLI